MKVFDELTGGVYRKGESRESLLKRAKEKFPDQFSKIDSLKEFYFDPILKERFLDLETSLMQCVENGYQHRELSEMLNEWEKEYEFLKTHAKRLDSNSQKAA